jgi:hypothetical protein
VPIGKSRDEKHFVYVSTICAIKSTEPSKVVFKDWKAHLVLLASISKLPGIDPCSTEPVANFTTIEVNPEQDALSVSVAGSR